MLPPSGVAAVAGKSRADNLVHRPRQGQLSPTTFRSISSPAQVITKEGHSARLMLGRVEDWRADFRRRSVFRRFRGGPQSGGHDHVSSPCRIERSGRVSRTTLTCSLRAMAYETYAIETTFRRSRRKR